MKTGDIVRRKLSSGVLVGSFKVVDCVMECGVYAHDIPQNVLGSMYYRKDEIQPISHITLSIPHAELKSVVYDKLSRVQHLNSIKWEKARKEQRSQQYKLVTLKSQSGHLIVSEPMFRQVTYKGKVYVEMTFLRILEQVGV